MHGITKLIITARPARLDFAKALARALSKQGVRGKIREAGQRLRWSSPGRPTHLNYDKSRRITRTPRACRFGIAVLINPDMPANLYAACWSKQATIVRRCSTSLWWRKRWLRDGRFWRRVLQSSPVEQVH